MRRLILVSMMAGAMLAVSGGSAAAALPEQPRTMAALGDSITRGYNACGWFFDCVDRSWSTGSSDRVDSHLRRIAASHPDLFGDVYNNARHGATSADLARQAGQAVEQDAEYVTVLVGTNDVCAATEADMTPAEEFGANVTAALDVLSEADIPHVFVASVPDVIRLWQVGHHSVDVRNTWELGGFCPTALSRADSTDPDDRERRERVAERLDAYNIHLANACARYTGCVYDAGAVHDYPFTLDHISAWDYFHPNQLGQATLADITWRSMQQG